MKKMFVSLNKVLLQSREKYFHCTSHCLVAEKRKSICVVFLPPNTLSRLQTMLYQGLIKCLKMNYLKRILVQIIAPMLEHRKISGGAFLNMLLETA